MSYGTDTLGDCPSCGHDLDVHAIEYGEVECAAQVDDGDDYQVDCWSCELTLDEFAALRP